MSADDDALLARRVDKIVAITDPETVEPTRAALLACGWAVCPGCGETWLSDISPETPWPVISDVADECRAHLATTGHGTSFDVGIEP